MSSRARFGSRRVALVAAAATLVTLGSLGGVAQSRSGAPASTRASAPSDAPLRVILYTTVPVHGKSHGPRPGPAARYGPGSTIARHLAALRWARADAAVVPWSRPGSAADRRFGAVLAAIGSTHAHVRAVALIDQHSLLSKVSALASKRASSHGYLRVGNHPALFVALADRGRRSCAEARRWRVAAGGFWLVQATFAGYTACRGAADAWFGDAGHARSFQAPGTYMTRPGIWPSGARAPKLRRTASSWKVTVQRMNSSGARLQLVDSLNDWARGTAIEPSNAWPSHSGFGKYLDALHAHSPARAPIDALPVVASVAISGATSHAVSVVANLAPGSDAATWWVEFGTTLAYGQATAPAPVAASRSPKPATTALTGLAPATTYHARVVVASTAGMVASDDAAFTTLGEARAMRVAAAGDIACDPASGAFNGGAGTASACHEVGVSNAILAGGYDAVLALGDTAVQQRHGQPVRRLVRPELGPLPGHHPSRGRQSRVRQPGRRAVLRRTSALRPGTRPRATTPTTWAHGT